MDIAAGPGSLVTDTRLVMCLAGFVAVMTATPRCLRAHGRIRKKTAGAHRPFMSLRAVGRAGSTLCGMNHVFAVVLAGKELRCACLIAALVGDCMAPRRRENPEICLWLPAALKICFAALIRILFFLLWGWICSQTVLSTVLAAKWRFFAGDHLAFDIQTGVMEKLSGLQFHDKHLSLSTRTVW